MKRLLTLSLLLATTYAGAAPFIVSDPLDPRATHCGWQINGGERVNIPVALDGADKICKINMAGRSAGTYIVTATAVDTDPTWGQESEPSDPFTLHVPGPLPSPSGLQVVP